MLHNLLEYIETRRKQGEARDEANCRSCLQSLLAMQQTFQEAMQQQLAAVASSVKEMSTKTERQLMELDKRLEGISEAVGMKPKNRSGNDDEDRKRIKEKFKVALENLQKHCASKIEPEGYLEYFFGIRKPNSRLGKLGSR